MSRRGGRKIGRNARTGKFAKVSVARKHKSTYVVETIRKGRRRRGS